jgi:hypothetical protein
MKKLIFFLIILFQTTISFGQNNYLVNRQDFILKLAVDSINFYESEIKSSPYLLPDNSIQIYPGEKIYIELELDNKEIKSIKTVRKNLNPQKTIIISFEQNTSGLNHELMMLEIKNPFKYDLEYKALIYLMEHKKWVSTNVLPVKANLLSYETWPDIIITMALSEWKFK